MTLAAVSRTAPADSGSATRNSEVAGRADFTQIRYAQCWEDADVLVRGLDVRPGDVCLSICSAGDNTLALLTRDPSRVVAVDLSPAQIACLRLRMAAYRSLEHGELLELIGSRESRRRRALYERCKRTGGLEDSAAAFWDDRPADIERGIGAAGKFEGYFRIFRRRVLPWVHGNAKIDSLLTPKGPEPRRDFYDRHWDTLRWRLMFRLFFSRPVMGRLGRDRSFFKYVEGSVGDRILARARHALRELDPSTNPYVHWILRERHGDALPLALRPEHFGTIRSRVGRVEAHLGSIESWLEQDGGRTRIDAFNLSDIFEYMSEQSTERLLRRLAGAARPGARLLYWNMLAPRERPESMKNVLEPVRPLADELLGADQTFFYSRLVIERVAGETA
jgi:S-adenosylmethionine:diacylglycerol 3-amino-3-carboxypropyl transferase